MIFKKKTLYLPFEIRIFTNNTFKLMKKIFTLVLLFTAILTCSAQEQDSVLVQTQDSVLPARSTIGIGLRGGVSSLNQKSAYIKRINRTVGGEGGIDIEFTHLWKSSQDAPDWQLGIKTGLNILYGSNTVKSDSVAQIQCLIDKEGNPIIYNYLATNVKESDRQLMLEIPLLFAMRHRSGFVANYGIKLNLPINGWYTINYQNPEITAYYTQLGVTETNEVVTGKLSETAPQQNNRLRTARLNLMFGLELGYEWTLKNNDALSLCAYTDISLASIYSKADGTETFISIDSPKAGGPTIYSNSIINAMGTDMGYFDAGIKLVYSFRMSNR